MKKNKKIFYIVKIVISVILCASSVLSMLGATLVNEGRKYILSEEFKTQIDNTDLNTVSFNINGTKFTVNEYVKNCIKDYIKTSCKYSDFLINAAVDRVLSSDEINKLCRDEAYKTVISVVNADVKEARQRLKNNVDPFENSAEKIKNAETVETAARIYIKTFILINIEKALRMPIDRVILLVSQSTVTKLIVLSVILLLLLVAVNYSSFFNLFIYSGAISIIYGIVIKIAQGKFVSANAGGTDLVGYVFAKPLVDSYSSNAVTAIVLGSVMLLSYLLIFFMVYKYMSKNDGENKDAPQK